MKFVPLHEFVYTEEAGVDALLGTDGDVLVPEGGDVMVYGDGGAGKTTLSIDLAFHLAAGDDWCGITVGRPVRVAIIENEGPRPLFRQKLRAKFDAWDGGDLGDRLHVLETPWGRFTFADEDHRAWLAAAVAQLELDVVIVGPLTRVGMNEAGTPQETRDFGTLLADTRRQANRPVTFVLIHHESKAGKVSGAWEGAGDTLLHVQAQGQGRTGLAIQKARWASGWHGKNLNLLWADGESFTVTDKQEQDASAIADAILAAVRGNGGCSWNTIEKAPGIGNAAAARRIRDQLLTTGQLIDDNAGKNSRAMLLWDTDDPLRPARLDADAPLDAHEAANGQASNCVLRPTLKGDADADADAASPASPPISTRERVTHAQARQNRR